MMGLHAGWRIGDIRGSGPAVSGAEIDAVARSCSRHEMISRSFSGGNGADGNYLDSGV